MLHIEPLARIEKLSPEQFRQEYDAPGKPVAIANALDWPAFGCWTHRWFKEEHGATEVDLSVNPTHTRKVVKMRLGAYIDRILHNQKMDGGLYLDQFPLERLPSLRQYFCVPAYCRPDRHIATHLWLGPGTTVLSFHKDNHNPLVQIDNIFVQIHGRKRIVLGSPDNDPYMYPRPRTTGAYWHSEVNPEMPDLERFPLLAQARLQETIVGPGDIVFIPRNYWHYVRALEPSISMSFWWNPSRLMEIASRILATPARDLEQLRASGDVLTSAQIVEFGGTARLQQTLAAFDDATQLEHLCKGLVLLADAETRATMSQWLPSHCFP